MKRIEPRCLKGFRDFDETNMAKRKYVEGIIRSVFGRFGYAEIETPILEYAEILLGKYGDEGEKLTYSFTDNGDRKVALRYDQTVPFARYAAENIGNITRPFKRFQIGSVFRADKPQKGRYRQFTQCDIDILGTDSLQSDFEVLAVVVEVFQALGIQNFKLKYSDRRFLESVLSKAKVAGEDMPKVISSIDKVDKIGVEKVLLEIDGLAEMDVIKLVLKDYKSTEEALENMAGFDIKRIQDIWELAKNLEIDKYIEFQPKISRGLDYYTGMVFETFVDEIGVGSICSGGRYDNLLSMFSKEVLSGVGFGLGFDRVVDVMEEQKLLDNISHASDYLVTVFDENSVKNSVKVAKYIREKGYNCELYLGNNLKLAKQFQYAEKRGIQKVVLVGESEQALFEKSKDLVVKNLVDGSQEVVTLN